MWHWPARRQISSLTWNSIWTLNIYRDHSQSISRLIEQIVPQTHSMQSTAVFNYCPKFLVATSTIWKFSLYTRFKQSTVTSSSSSYCLHWMVHGKVQYHTNSDQLLLLMLRVDQILQHCWYFKVQLTKLLPCFATSVTYSIY